MCDHVYTADYKARPKDLGLRCPYGDRPELPHDEARLCIFHSRDADWKRRNGFTRHFEELLEQLATDESVKAFDFAEFVFVADEDGAESAQPATFRIAATTLAKRCYFVAAVFLDRCELRDVDFAGGVCFSDAVFEEDLWVEKVRFAGFDFISATFHQRAVFLDVESVSYALFQKSSFHGTGDGQVVRFERSRFAGITDFSSVEAFLGSESSIYFGQAAFEDFVNFKEAHFRCQVVFDEVSFSSEGEFVDTVFTIVPTTARYRGAAVEFNRIRVGVDAVLHFESTDPVRKMFEHDVQFSFEGDPAGIVRFQNVNFNRLKPASKERLTRLTRSGRVEIGSGCIKYRFQTPPRSIVISDGHTALVVEICQTFASYFSATSGYNLGVEIVERDRTKVTLFYFTDEDTTEAQFLDRLKLAEQSLWDLLSRRPDRRLLALPDAATQAVSATDVGGFLNAVDGLSALMGTFFRVGARIAFGRWRPEDTRSLLQAIDLGAEGADQRALDIHSLLVERYSASDLFGLSRRQHAALAAPRRELAAGAEQPVATILFVAANAALAPLALDREVKRIRGSLRQSAYRDHLRFEQEWAVTIESLTQAMIEHSPTVVHFSGHGTQPGLALQDEDGNPKIVATDALSRFFGLFAGTVRCVLLNACCSEAQARAIREHVPYVIGISSRLADSAAIAFSSGFYRALGAGREIEAAFDLGRAAIEMEGLQGEKAPILF